MVQTGLSFRKILKIVLTISSPEHSDRGIGEDLPVVTRWPTTIWDTAWQFVKTAQKVCLTGTLTVGLACPRHYIATKICRKRMTTNQKISVASGHSVAGQGLN